MKRIGLFILLSTVLVGSAVAQRNPKNLKLAWKTDTMKRSVPLNEFLALMMPDEIPTIYFPEFLPKKKALKTYFEHEPVICVEYKMEAHAYPLSVLLYHEIVNDEIHSLPFSVTYCPLCNAAIVFKRRMSYDSTEYNLTFGTSGMLRKSDMVMYDRNTESWWQQATGEALVGKMKGAKLEYYPSQVLSLKEFYETYPDGLVLSDKNNTQHNFKYGESPYVKYDDLGNKQPKYYKDSVDARLPAVERLITFVMGDAVQAYTVADVAKEGVINDKVGETPVVLFHSDKTVSVLDSKLIEESKAVGSTTAFDRTVKGEAHTFVKKDGFFYDTKTNSKWLITGKCIEGEYKDLWLEQLSYGNHFAFAWLHFYPESKIYKH